jgi:hypothetical protein
MFGVGVGVRVGGRTIVSSGGGFDPDAQAFFDRVTTAGGTLTETEKNATNTLVVTMKADGTWTPMKAVYPMVGASAAACAQNLKSSSFTGSFSTGWTFASTGVTPNGTSAYMDTTLNPSVSISSNQSESLSFYSRTIGGSNASRMSMGGFEGSSDTSLLIKWTDGKAYSNINESTYNTFYTNADTHGFYLANRNATNTEQGWKNGVKQIQASNTPQSLTNRTLYLGAFNNIGTPLYFDNKQCAFASIGEGLTDTQASNFYTAVQAFQTTLSRNV